MSINPFSNVDSRKWFDRMQPQTLAFATWLLYINGAFAIIDYLDRNNLYSAWSRTQVQGIVALITCLSYIAGGFLMANGKKIGYYASLFAAFSPFLLRLMIRMDFHSISIRWVITQSDTFGFLFEIALCALLLHPMSRTYAKTWFR